MAFTKALRSTHRPIQWVLEALSLGVKWVECDAVPLLPHMPSWYDASLNTGTTLFYKEISRQIR